MQSSFLVSTLWKDASGKKPLMSAVRDGFRFLIKSPHKFVRTPAFLMIWGVFAGTYTVANVVESTCHHYKQGTSVAYGRDAQQQPDWFWPKFGFSSVTNVTLSVTKDHYYTQWFGAGKPHKVPLGSYFMYGTRDAMTIMVEISLI